MADYVITVLFDDQPEPLVVELPGVELETAEAFTGQLRYDVEEAKSINAPVFTTTVPAAEGAGAELALDPRHVRAIDLSEGEQ